MINIFGGDTSQDTVFQGLSMEPSPNTSLPPLAFTWYAVATGSAEAGAKVINVNSNRAKPEPSEMSKYLIFIVYPSSHRIHLNPLVSLVPLPNPHTLFPYCLITNGR